ncbi:hypothetical protein ANCCAN_26532 [Ancylostoma caninum]|uniref:Uncharacterized protein n=1 Tax=Ancylostoma caninum TaxID=29170 RepID=A0A368F6N8_ANCCA|nr:hypothetical protein ANCCAN_26532 [Ancylostoma caninum]
MCSLRSHLRTFQDEYKEAALQRALVLEKGNFLGAPRHYDHGNKKWKYILYSRVSFIALHSLSAVGSVPTLSLFSCRWIICFICSGLTSGEKHADKWIKIFVRCLK